MKTLLIIPVLLISVLSFSQVNKTEVENLKIEIEVESLKELKEAFKKDDFKAVFDEIETKGDVEFKLICLKPSINDENTSQKIAYKVVVDGNDQKTFSKISKRLYKSAKKYYIN